VEEEEMVVRQLMVVLIVVVAVVVLVVILLLLLLLQPPFPLLQVTAVEMLPPEANRLAEKVAKLEGDVAHLRSSSKSRLKELGEVINQGFAAVDQQVRRRRRRNEQRS